MLWCLCLTTFVRTCYMSYLLPFAIEYQAIYNASLSVSFTSLTCIAASLTSILETKFAVNAALNPIHLMLFDST